MYALGLDPSLRAYGWAVYKSDGLGRDKRVASGHSGTLSSTVPPARFLHFQSMVADLLRKFPYIDVVGIESPAYDAGPFQTIHFGLMQFSMASVFEARKDLVLFDPATVKSLCYPGKKTDEVTKLDMQRYVQIDTMDLHPIDNNEADAYVVARFACRMKMLKDSLLPPEELSPGEVHTFIGKTKKVKSKLGTRIKRSAHIFRENRRFYDFSRVPAGSVSLPEKNAISPTILEFLEKLEAAEAAKMAEKKKPLKKRSRL